MKCCASILCTNSFPCWEFPPSPFLATFHPSKLIIGQPPVIIIVIIIIIIGNIYWVFAMCLKLPFANFSSCPLLCPLLFKDNPK